MKVFLLIRTEYDDLDVIYGIFSSRENAEEAIKNDKVWCASIEELELDKLYLHE